MLVDEAIDLLGDLLFARFEVARLGFEKEELVVDHTADDLAVQAVVDGGVGKVDLELLRGPLDSLLQIGTKERSAAHHRHRLVHHPLTERSTDPLSLTGRRNRRDENRRGEKRRRQHHPLPGTIHA